jgi:hypothetical protein
LKTGMITEIVSLPLSVMPGPFENKILVHLHLLKNLPYYYILQEDKSSI